MSTRTFKDGVTLELGETGARLVHVDSDIDVYICPLSNQEKIGKLMRISDQTPDPVNFIEAMAAMIADPALIFSSGGKYYNHRIGQGLFVTDDISADPVDWALSTDSTFHELYGAYWTPVL